MKCLNCNTELEYIDKVYHYEKNNGDCANDDDSVVEVIGEIYYCSNCNTYFRYNFEELKTTTEKVGDYYRLSKNRYSCGR